MTVKELKEAIANLPDEMEVILQHDTHGSSYGPLLNIDPDTIYIPETYWFGDVYSIYWTFEEANVTEEEWEKIKIKSKSLLLYP